MKRSIIFLCLCMVALLTCFLCYPLLQSDEAGHVQVRRDRLLTFFGNQYEALSVQKIEEIFERFMSEHQRVSVVYESIKGTDYYKVLMARSESGRLDDMFIVDHDSVLVMQDRGQLADLSDLRAVRRYDEAILEKTRLLDGAVRWLPMTVSAFGLYCNLDLLEKYGKSVPKNLPEWEELCAFFKGMGITPIVANNDISIKTLAIGYAFDDIYQRNRQKEVFTRVNEGREKLGDLLLPGFAFVERFIKKGWIDPAVALRTKKTRDDLAIFAEGKQPFMLTGAWAARRVEARAPALRFAVLPFPIRQDGYVLVGNLDIRVALSANGENLALARELLEYMLLPENHNEYVPSVCSLSPVRTSGQILSPKLHCIEKTYAERSMVIGSDGFLRLPIWNLLIEASARLLRGEDSASVMKWLDEAAAPYIAS